MIKFHEKARDNFNKKGNEYLEKVEQIPLESLKIRHSILTGRLTINAKKDTIFDPNLGIYSRHENTWVGITPEIGKEVVAKLVNGICRVKSVDQTCTFEFIRDQVFTWLISTKVGKIDTPLIDFLIKEITTLIGEYQYYFKVKNLKVDNDFQVGEVVLSNFTPRLMEGLLNKTVKEEQKEEFRNTLTKTFKDDCICRVTVKDVTEEKGFEIALKKSRLSISILKILSPYFQEHTFDPCNFDLEHFLPSEEIKSTLVLKNPQSKTRKAIRLARNRPPIQKYHIDILRFENMKYLRLHEYSNFLLRKTNSKLDQLIHQFIDLLGEAISEKDFHNKIVKYCTIMDVIFQRNENSPILESIKKYFPPIVTDTKEGSLQLKKTIPKIYEIRSKKIHHNIDSNFRLEHLGIIQHYLHSLLLNLVLLSKNYEDIDQIFVKIDQERNDAINSVFIHE